MAPAEVWDSSTGGWTPTGSMATPRYNFGMVPLPTGEGQEPADLTFMKLGSRVEAMAFLELLTRCYVQCWPLEGLARLVRIWGLRSCGSLQPAPGGRLQT